MQVWLLSWASPAVFMSGRGNKVLVEAADAILESIKQISEDLCSFWANQISTSRSAMFELIGNTDAVWTSSCLQKLQGHYQLLFFSPWKKITHRLKKNSYSWNHPMFFLNPLPSMEVFFITNSFLFFLFASALLNVWLYSKFLTSFSQRKLQQGMLTRFVTVSCVCKWLACLDH